MGKKIGKFGLLFLALSFALNSEGWSLTIAREGAAVAVIVIAPGADETVQYAASELADFLNQVTGGTFAIVNTPDPVLSDIYVGPGAAMTRDPSFTTVGLGEDGIVIRTIGEDLILAGGAPRGTNYSVYTFLEDEVGVHWWTATESTIPQTPTLMVEKLDVLYVPTFESRGTSYAAAIDGDFSVRNKLNGPIHQTLRDEQGGTKYRYVDPDRWGSHSFFSYLPPNQYFIAHPEWYALIDGQRSPEELDLTNEEMRQEFVNNVRNFLREDHFLDVHTFSPLAPWSGLSEVRFYLDNSDDFVGNPGPGNGWDTSGAISATASSEYPGRAAAKSIDGSGLDADGLLHGTVWLDSDPDSFAVFTSGHRDASAPNMPRPGSVDGEHWIQFEFDQVYQLGEMWIWNMNLDKWHLQGMKNVTIQYSVTGSSNPADWTTIYSGKIVKAIGVPAHTHDAEIDFGGAKAKYVVITSHNNWADMSDVTIAPIAQMDGTYRCGCSDCTAIVNQEGSYSGLILRFVNSVVADLQDEFPDKMFSTYAYHHTANAPNLTAPRDDVIVRLVAEVYHSAPVDHEGNPSFHNKLEAWSQITENLYIYEYAPSFQDALSPFPNLRVLGRNIKIYAEHGVKGIFAQGWGRNAGTELEEIRIWVWSKLMWNPDLDADALIEEFCNGYYGAGGEEVLASLDVIHDAMVASGHKLGQGTSYDASFLTFNTLYQSWIHLSAAEAAVQGDPELLLRVRVAQIPVMYVVWRRWSEMQSAAQSAGVTWPWPSKEALKDYIYQIGMDQYGELFNIAGVAN